MKFCHDKNKLLQAYRNHNIECSIFKMNEQTFSGLDAPKTCNLYNAAMFQGVNKQRSRIYLATAIQSG